MAKITLQDIQKAQENIKHLIKKTDLVESTKLSQHTDAHIFLKCDNLQKTGSFKLRGAFNKITNLTEEERNHGVIAASAGNHAQGVALAAQMYGIKSTIVMPETAPLAKVSETKSYGSNIILDGLIFDDALERALKEQKKSNATLIHAFNDDEIITGQGTIGLEILEQIEHVDTILCPVGGGGLISGLSIAVKGINPKIKIIGVEAANVPSAQESLKQNKITTKFINPTIADGIAVKTPGDKTFPIMKEFVDKIVTVEEKDIANAILFLIENQKLVVEGAGAVSTAALINGAYKPKKGENVVAILSGGNIDVGSLEKNIDFALTSHGRRFSFKTKITNQPGGLGKLTEITNNLKSNIINVNLRRSYSSNYVLGILYARIELETFDYDHINQIRKSLNKAGFELEE